MNIIDDNINYTIHPEHALYKSPLHKSIDFYSVIKDDMRNFRPLNKFQLEYVNALSHNEKNELLAIYNSVVEQLMFYLADPKND